MKFHYHLPLLFLFQKTAAGLCSGCCGGPVLLLVLSGLLAGIPVVQAGNPIANSAVLTGCAVGGGTLAYFDLTEAEPAVTGNLPYDVLWFLDAAGTNPISDETVFLSTSTTVFAQVTDGICYSGIVPVMLTVSQPFAPVVSGFPDTFCQNNGAVSLPDVLDGIAGSWSGPGVFGNIFDPAAANAASTLTFTPEPGQCANPAILVVTVTAPVIPALSGIPLSVCETAQPLTLPTMQGSYTGTWSGPGVSSNTFVPAGQSGTVVLTYTPAEACTAQAPASVMVTEGLNAINITENCDASTQFFTVHFDIVGGTGSYIVNGLGLINSFFDSQPYDNGNNYSLVLSDTSGCQPVLLSGVVDCTCATPVTFSLNQSLCSGESLTVNGTVYDAAQPVGTETILGGSYLGCDSVIAVSLSFFAPSTAAFTQTLCPGESLTVNGTVYDAAQPVGTETILGGSYLGCDSVIAVSLSFFAPSTAAFTQTLCPGESLTVNGTVYNAAHPVGTEIMAGAAGSGCDSIVVVDLSFGQNVTASLNQTLCPGESLMVNGLLYNATHPAGVEVIAGGAYLGCDSVISVNLSFYPTAVFILSQTLCINETLTVNGTVYDYAHPAGTEILANAAVGGCDSTVEVNLSFYAAVSILEPVLCFGSQLTVNGTLYNEAHPGGTEVLNGAGQAGCDSTILVHLTFGNAVVVDFDTMLCAGEVLYVNGALYFAGHTAGTETFVQASYLGCDSLVNVTVGYFPEALLYLDLTLHPGESTTINGNLYNQQQPEGIEVLPGGSFFGCDSLVFVHLTFEGLTEAVVTVAPPLCLLGEDGSIQVDTLAGGTPPYLVALNGAGSMPVFSYPFFYNDLNSGFYQLTIVDGAGVVSSQEIYIPDAVPPDVHLGDDQTVPLGGSVQLTALSSGVLKSWMWSPPDFLTCTDCPSPVAQPLNDVTYTVEVSDENGCTAVGTVTVVVEKLRQVYVPDAISANNDAVNDELTVFSGAQVALVRVFQVFDRWGSLIFERRDFQPNDLQLGWDATFRGRPTDPGEYVWMAEVEFLDGYSEVFEGGVTVIR